MAPASMPADAPVRWTSIVGAGLALRVAARARLLGEADYWRREAMGQQVRQLRRLLRRARETEFGRAHGFARLAHIADDRELVEAYRRAVPVREYAGFAQWCAQMREQGRRDVLWPGLVRDFAQTSGTTAGDKYMPVSREMLRSNYLASLDIFAQLMRFGASIPWLTGGRVLFLGGSSDVEANEHGVRTADLSGLVTPMIRWPLSAIYAPGHRIALMDHWPSKIDAMARACIDMDVRMISGMPSWALVLFNRMLELAGEQGRGSRRVADLWPNLAAFVHGGVKYDPFLPRVNQVVFGDPEVDFPHRLELYPASEAFVAIQDRPGRGGLRLLTDIGNFFEFVPLDEIGREDPPAFIAGDVEPGERYVVVLSTCAGLWRYVLGDVVVFEDVPDAIGGRRGSGPPRLRIVGRHRHFINAFGENLIVEHIERAVAVAAAAAGLEIGEFSAAPVYPQEGRRAGLELVAESSPPPAPAALERFAAAFDASLKEQNVDYTTKRRDDLGMAPPSVTIVPMGSFHRWMDARGKLGGQHKTPRCANHRDIVEGVKGAAAATSAR